MYMITKYVI